MSRTKALVLNFLILSANESTEIRRDIGGLGGEPYQREKIVENINEPVVVVVSALGGITDRLIRTSQLAVAGDDNYRNEFDAIVDRHHGIIDAVIPAGAAHDTLKAKVDALLDELRSIYHGVYLIRDMTQKTANVIVSYGERMSSQIVSAFIEGSQCYDSREFIKTVRKQNRNLVDFDVTIRLVIQTFARMPRIAVVPGFIASDANDGETTNLGRGGSDYTAAIIAAALNASALEIWTDVDGFMTADPRVIPNAYTIDELSYNEAMELCNFGAKIIYPPTIYPVRIKNIPILVKNTFRPEAKGSIIHKGTSNDTRAIKGISSVKNTSLVTVSGPSMVGVIGVNRRIFTTLADNGISVFLVAQTSSEASTSLCVTDEDGEKAREVLDNEFAKEISTGAMNHALLTRDLSTMSVVGDKMKHTAGVAGKLFGVLGRNGINIVAMAQGATETNVSIVVDRSLLRKSLNVIHDSFFLSEYQVLNLFVCGVGTVGAKLLEQISSQREKLMRERGLKLNIVGIASGHNAAFNRDGVDYVNYRETLKAGGPSSVKRLRDEVTGMNIFNSVFVDCTASKDVADLYQTFFEHNISVVAANKIAASSSYANYKRLKQTARAKGVKYLFETNVGAGLPIINTINNLTGSGDKILCIEAVLSGTLNYVFNVLSDKVTLSRAVQMARDAGYSEPDPRIDLCGKDVIRKLVILAREAGYEIETSDVEAVPFIPEELMKGTADDFMRQLPELDAEFEKRRSELAAQGKRWRYVAKLDNGHASVGLQAVDARHPFYNLEGSNNIILLTTERYREYPMHIEGYGAGADVTAAGVFADIMSIANI